MFEFLDEPTEATGLMPQAIDHYGPMAMLPLAETELNAAVRLIAAGQVERPHVEEHNDTKLLILRQSYGGRVRAMPLK